MSSRKKKKSQPKKRPQHSKPTAARHTATHAHEAADRLISDLDGLTVSASSSSSSSPGEGSSSRVQGNHVPSTAIGCHISFLGEDDWTFGLPTPYEPDDFGLKASESPPDLSLDPQTRVLTAINASESEYRCFYVTIEKRPVVGRRGQLTMGRTRDNLDNEQQCTTLVVVLRPRTVVDVCLIVVPVRQLKSVVVRSDVSDVSVVSEFFAIVDTLEPARTYLFPLKLTAPSLCSQGHRGHFTHFNPYTRHAIDLQCPVGTPVLALANGTVVDVQDRNFVSGIDVANLYHWNSIMLQLDDGMYAEYVHIQPRSACVQKGDRVLAGQVICASGDIGFCPSPHLHLQLHNSAEKNAVTVPFAFRAADGSSYIPEAGCFYDQNGPVSVPDSITDSLREESPPPLQSSVHDRAD